LVVALLLAGCSQPPTAQVTLPADSNVPVDSHSDANVVVPDANETVVTGSLDVSVFDSNHVALSGADVSVFDRNGGSLLAQALTDSAGRAVFTVLLSGDVFVVVERNGFVPASGTMTVPVASVAFAELTLQPVVVLSDAAQTAYRTVILDDSEFSPSLLYVPQGATLVLTIRQSTFNSVSGGADIESPAFEKFSIKNGEEHTVTFLVPDDLRVQSYALGSTLHKATLQVHAVVRDWR
jgi:hypothetical protein